MVMMVIHIVAILNINATVLVPAKSIYILWITAWLHASIRMFVHCINYVGYNYCMYFLFFIKVMYVRVAT